MRTRDHAKDAIASEEAAGLQLAAIVDYLRDADDGAGQYRLRQHEHPTLVYRWPGGVATPVCRVQLDDPEVVPRSNGVKHHKRALKIIADRLDAPVRCACADRGAAGQTAERNPHEEESRTVPCPLCRGAGVLNDVLREAT